MTDMPHVDRFVCTEREDGTPTMELRELGGWVSHRDWEKAQCEIAEMKRRLQEYGSPGSFTWQDISTAPKDGTRILLWLSPQAFAVPAEWRDRWMGDDFPLNMTEPTHWMPLPPAPGEALEGGKADMTDKTLPAKLREGVPEYFDPDGGYSPSISDAEDLMVEAADALDVMAAEIKSLKDRLNESLPKLRESLNDLSREMDTKDAKIGHLLSVLRPFAKTGELFDGYDGVCLIYDPAKGPEWRIDSDDLKHARDAYEKNRDG
jgi:hypothetical protein